MEGTLDFALQATLKLSRNPCATLATGYRGNMIGGYYDGRDFHDVGRRSAAGCDRIVGYLFNYLQGIMS